MTIKEMGGIQRSIKKQETVLLTELPPMLEVKVHMESPGACTVTFLETFQLLNAILVLPEGKASVVSSFSSMKHIKTNIDTYILLLMIQKMQKFWK